MNKTTLVIYAIIVGVAILSSVLKKRKKAAGTGQVGQKKPVIQFNQTTNIPNKQPTSTQPKSLEDLLQSLLGEQNPAKKVAPKLEEKLVFTDKEPEKYTTLEDTTALETVGKEEVQFYSYDQELNYKDELVNYDKTTDHHLHGGGFGEMNLRLEEEEMSEWADIDWRKAIITAEILKRPEY